MHLCVAVYTCVYKYCTVNIRIYVLILFCIYENIVLASENRLKQTYSFAMFKCVLRLYEL